MHCPAKTIPWANCTMDPSKAKASLCFLVFVLPCLEAACVPSGGCQAVAWYKIALGEQLNQVYTRFATTYQQLQEFNAIPDESLILADQEILIPISCSCSGDYLQHIFTFRGVNATDTLQTISEQYHNLTTPDMISAANPSTGSRVYPDMVLSVPVNCSCGSPKFPLYGLFMTYPSQAGDTADGIASKFNTTRGNLTAYNPSANLNALSSNTILFLPAKFLNGTYPRFSGEDGGKSNSGVVVGASVGGAAALVLIIAALLWFFVYLPRKRASLKQHSERAHLNSRHENGGPAMSPLSDFAIDKSVEFPYEELAAATSNFSISNKIGQGGFGSVYYGESRNLKLAIKMMNLQAGREFVSELKVLTRVHHTNLVQLIGYSTGEHLFLVYEYVNNGTLSHHLRGAGVPPLPWGKRVQIALDAARGLEYIHEHTKPSYIHRDVKSPNILIDQNFRAKVADFGLTKLTESTGAGSTSLTQPTRLVGTFGYMPPEYARFGDVSPKIDVYSFGVVLYEIVSAKDAIVRGNEAEGVLPRGLVTMFDTVLKGPNPREDLKSLVDPSLGTNYPFESVWKFTKLAEACTNETPENRPSMRTVVVALMTLCSETQEIDLGGYSESQIGIVSGR